VFGTIRRRDVTAAIPVLETGGRKTVQVQLLSSVPMSSGWDSVIARSRGRPLTVTNRSYAGLAESADAPGREPGGRIQSAMGVQISRSAPSTQEIVVKVYGARRRDRGCCPSHDNYPPDRYGCTRARARRRAQQPRKTSARLAGRKEIYRELRDLV